MFSFQYSTLYCALFLIETAKTFALSINTLPSSINSPSALFKCHSLSSKFSSISILSLASPFISLHKSPLPTAIGSLPLTFIPSSPFTVRFICCLFEVAKTILLFSNLVSSFINSPFALPMCHSAKSKYSFAFTSGIISAFISSHFAPLDTFTLLELETKTPVSPFTVIITLSFFHLAT